MFPFNYAKHYIYSHFQVFTRIFVFDICMYLPIFIRISFRPVTTFFIVENVYKWGISKLIIGSFEVCQNIKFPNSSSRLSTPLNFKCRGASPGMLSNESY